jgi:hypothetical protein
MLFSFRKQKTEAVVSQNITDRRSGQDRRQLADRRAEPRFGDVMERRQGRDRRRAISNMSID